MGVARRSDQRDHGADVEVSRDCHLGAAGQKERSSSNNSAVEVAEAAEWNRWEAPKTYLGSRRISKQL
jgi:hypothetical protein